MTNSERCDIINKSSEMSENRRSEDRLEDDGDSSLKIEQYEERININLVDSELARSEMAERARERKEDNSG